jgi:hypothetical protein
MEIHVNYSLSRKRAYWNVGYYCWLRYLENVFKEALPSKCFNNPLSSNGLFRHNMYLIVNKCSLSARAPSLSLLSPAWTRCFWRESSCRVFSCIFPFNFRQRAAVGSRVQAEIEVNGTVCSLNERRCERTPCSPRRGNGGGGKLRLWI